MQNDSFSLKLFQDFIVWQVELVCIVVETDTKETRNWQNPWRAEKYTSESISQIKIKGARTKNKEISLMGFLIYKELCHH